MRSVCMQIYITLSTCFVKMCSKRDTIAWTVNCILYIYSSIIISTFLFHKMYIKYTGKITGIICIVIQSSFCIRISCFLHTHQILLKLPALHKRLSRSALNNTIQTTNDICCRFSVVITVVITHKSQGSA